MRKIRYWETPCMFCRGHSIFYQTNHYCECRLDRIVAKYLRKRQNLKDTDVTQTDKFKKWAKMSYAGTRGVILDRRRNPDKFKKKGNPEIIQKHIPTPIEKNQFYASREWKEIRFKVFVRRGRKCNCCGAAPPEVVLHVDHIKPLSIYWDLRLQLKNLQVLCGDYNIGKSNLYEGDFSN